MTYFSRSNSFAIFKQNPLAHFWLLLHLQLQETKQCSVILRLRPQNFAVKWLETSLCSIYIYVW